MAVYQFVSLYNSFLKSFWEHWVHQDLQAECRIRHSELLIQKIDVMPIIHCVLFSVKTLEDNWSVQFSLPKWLSELPNTENEAWAEEFWITALRFSLHHSSLSVFYRGSFYFSTDSTLTLCCLLSTTYTITGCQRVPQCHCISNGRHSGLNNQTLPANQKSML